MRVAELIDILRDQDPESEVELAIVAPVDEESDDITVDRYTVEGVLPWEPDTDEAADDEGVTVWLVGGEEDDVEAFLDAVEFDDDDDDEHEHDHDHGDHGHEH